MSFVEKFRRTPKFVIWLITALIGSALGYVASIALMPQVFIFQSNLYQRLLWRVFGDWDVVAGTALSFAAVPVVAMFALTCVLPFHHLPRRVELVLAACIPSLWPAWFTVTEVPRSLWREATVAWGLYLVFVVGTWFLCDWVVRRRVSLTSSEPQESEALKARL